MKSILAFILAISLWTSAHSVVQAQVTLQCGNIIDSCGFPSPPVPAFYTTTNQLLQYTPTALGIDYPRIVNVAIHLVANSSGQLAVTPAQATASINQLNTAFNTSGIGFAIIKTDTITNNDYYNINPILRFDLFQQNRVPKALNIYYVNTIDGANGWAEGVPGRAFMIAKDFILTPTMAHEVGHCFWLYHTFEQCRFGKENIERSLGQPCFNALYAGDQLHDTNAEFYEPNVRTPCENLQAFNTNPQNFMTWNSALSFGTDPRNQFTEGQLARMHYILMHNLVDLLEMPVVFGNYFQSELITNTPTRPSTLTANNTTVLSGQSLTFLRGSEVSAKTNQERFVGYVSPTQGTLNIKHHNWNGSPSKFRSSQSFIVSGVDSMKQNSFFLPYQPATVRASLIDGPNFNWAGVELRDPWRVDSQGNQPDAFAFYPSTSNNTNGVFQDQEVVSNQPFYSVRALDTVTTSGGITGVRVDRIPNLGMAIWEGVGVSIQTSNAVETPVMFTAPNAVVSARYKGRLLSSLAEASSQSGSQRRFARDVTAQSVYYLVYESAGKIWLTYTTNSGASWQPERFIGDGTRPSLASSQEGVALSYVASDSEGNSEVQVRAFSLNPFTGALNEVNSVTNLLPCTMNAVPTTVWLGNDNSPTSDAKPRYAVFYETQGTTQQSTQINGAVIRLSMGSNTAELFTLSNSQVSSANMQLYPASDHAVLPNAPGSATISARLVYRQRSGSEGWLRYQPLTFDFSSAYSTTLTQGTAQTLNWIGSGRAEPAGCYPTKPSVEVKNNLTYIAFEVEGKNDVRYTTVNSSHQQGAVTVFSQAGEVLRLPSLHLQPNSTAPAIYFNMNGAVYEARWTAQNNWHIQKVATDGEHANIAVRSGNRRFVYTANVSAPFRLAFADGTTDGDAGSGGGNQQQVVGSGGKGNTPSLVLNNGGGTSPSTALTTLERTTGVLSNQAESATLALTLADVGLNGSSRTGLTYHDLGANLLPDTLALSASNVFSLLKSRQFTLADTVNQMTATVKVHSKALYDLTQNNPVQLSVELFNVATGNSLALSQTALVTASDTAKDFHFTMNLPNGLNGTDVELRVKVLGFAIQALHKASALNEIELVSGVGGTAIVNRVGGQATQSVGSVPTKFALHQNYPNPFNPVTVIRYELPEASAVKVQVFDVLGRVVATVVNERRDAGIYEVPFNASGLSSGTYFYRLQAGTFVETKKMMLVK